jgi:diguanylate cyclase (GGDEF)-like protein/PAS domain S-box-containing protein
MLIVPLLNRHEKTLGYFSIDCPANGKLPGNDVISDLETFAQQAVLTLEQAELLEHLEAESVALAQSEERFSKLAEAPFECIVIHDRGTILMANQAFALTFGYDQTEVIGMSVLEFAAPESLALVQRNALLGLEEPYEAVGLRKDGTRFCGELRGKPIPYGGRTVRVVAIRDITERKQAEEKLRQSEERFRLLVQHSSDIISVLAADGSILYESPASGRVMGRKPEDLTGRNAFEFLHPDDVQLAQEVFAVVLSTPGITSSIQFRFAHRDGSWRWLDGTANNLLADERVNGIVVNARDITERKAFEEQLRHQALHDALTGLPNRVHFLDRLNHALARTARHHSTASVLYIDVDRLKRVNDSLGHDAGDALLVRVAERLRGSVRPEDTVARLSGDEFAVLVEEIGKSGEVIAIAERIVRELAGPFIVENHEVVATASIGIAVGSSAETTPESLLQAADVAMYRAKDEGGARYAVYGAAKSSLALERLGLEMQLRGAMERQEFEVHYRPLVELETGRIADVEALVRWRHPERGLLRPSEFIGLAEETGLIVPIGRWVLEQACRQVREWRELYPSNPPLGANVNLSGLEFRHPEIVGEVDRILRESGLEAGGLELEITETVVMADDEAVAPTLRGLDGLGVLLAIDDFGTGYSSLSHLKRFPIRTLKIDREFVAGLDRGPEDAAIVGAVLGLGRTLGLRVVAEGVDTTEHLVALRALGCELGQGYYLSQPLPAWEMGTLLSGGQPLLARDQP